MRAFSSFTTIALLLLAGCGLSESQASADAEKALRAAQDTWAGDWARHDTEKVVAGYAPDAHANYSGAAFWVGRDAIGQGVASYFADPAFKIEFPADRVRIDKSGNLAMTGGTYHLQYTDPASHRLAHENGHYVLVWQKQADGSWKVAEDITAVEPAAAAAASKS